MTTYSRDAYLQRDKLPSTAFAIPERRAWPIHNLRHAHIALRYMREGKGDRKDYPRIRRALAARWPGVTESARDIQVIIKDSGSSSKPKRQRYNPAKAKAKKRKGKFVRKKPLGGNFHARMRAKYGDQGSSLNTQDSARDPKGFQKTIYRKCPCGETAHGFEGRKNDRELEYKCRNCHRVIIHRPEYLKPLTREEWDRKERRRTSRDFADELRHLSLQALGRLLTKAYRQGDDAKCSAIEREIDRRGKGAMLSRYSRRHR
jgi:hypothetical protein